MSFLSNDGYAVTKVILTANPAAGALPATWTLFNGTQTPRDVAGYPVSGGWGYEPSTAVASPILYWNSESVSYIGRYMRASGSLRVCDNLGPGQGRGAAWLLLIAGTRAAGDGWGTYYGFGTDQAENEAYGALEFMQKSGITGVKYALNSNKWYRFGLELLKDNLYGYVDPVGYSLPSDIPGDDDLTYVSTVSVDSDSNDIYVGCALSGSFSSTNYPGFADLKLEKLSPLASGMGTNPPTPDTIPPPPNTEYTELVAPPPSGYTPTPFTWEPPELRKLEAADAFAYKRYKTIRTATNTLNNLVLQP